MLGFAAAFAPELKRNRTVPDNAEVQEAVRKICGEIQAEYGCGIVLTRGVKPMWVFDRGVFEECPLIKPPPRKMSITDLNDVSAAGFFSAHEGGISAAAFTAGLVSALDAGLGNAAAEGARCGALNAGFPLFPH
jgi:hypothetical protein